MGEDTEDHGSPSAEDLARLAETHRRAMAQRQAAKPDWREDVRRMIRREVAQAKTPDNLIAAIAQSIEGSLKGLQQELAAERKAREALEFEVRTLHDELRDNGLEIAEVRGQVQGMTAMIVGDRPAGAALKRIA